MKRLLVIAGLFLVMALFPSCDGGEPSPNLEIEFSFPYGAPPLNQQAELLCTAFLRNGAIGNLKVWVELPEALQLVSGELSWTGSLAKGQETPTVKAVVRSVRTGQWELRVHHYIPPEEYPGTDFGPGQPIYVQIGEDEAKWGENEPWYGQLPTGPSSNYTPPPAIHP